MKDKNDLNGPEIYDVFCSYIDLLTSKLNCTGFEAEEMLFSVGRDKGHWRNYLINN